MPHSEHPTSERGGSNIKSNRPGERLPLTKLDRKRITTEGQTEYGGVGGRVNWGEARDLGGTLGGPREARNVLDGGEERVPTMSRHHGVHTEPGKDLH